MSVTQLRRSIRRLVKLLKEGKTILLTYRRKIIAEIVPRVHLGKI